MPKVRRAIRDAKKPATVSRKQVVTAAKEIKKSRTASHSRAKSSTYYKSAPKLHRKK